MQSSGVVYGIGTYIQQMVEYLKNRKDISLNIVIRHSNEKKFKIKESDGYRTFYFPRINDQYNPGFDPIYNRNICYLIRLHIQVSFSDQLIFHLNYYEEGTLIPYLKNEYPDSKVIFTIHYQRWCFLTNGNTSYFRRLIHKYNEALSDNEKWVLTTYATEKRVLQSVDHIICLAKYTQDILVKDYGIPPEKLERIYNGLKDEGKTLSLKERCGIRKKLSFSDDELLILFVGRLDKIKGLDILIMAFKIILKTHSQARLVIVGDGDYNIYLKECEDYWERITFTGRLDRKILYQFYQIADIGVMPSYHEQCSYVAIEMMMFGLPIVISTSTGLSEMLSKETNPYKTVVHETGNEGFIIPDELASAVLTALQDREYGKRIRDHYEKVFTGESMGRLYNQLLNRLV